MSRITLSLFNLTVSNTDNPIKPSGKKKKKKRQYGTEHFYLFFSEERALFSEAI